MNPFIWEGMEGEGMEHKGMGRDLVCQQDRFPIVPVWKFFVGERIGGIGETIDAACCATSPTPYTIH